MVKKPLTIGPHHFSKKGDAVMARNKSQPEPITPNQKSPPVDWESLLAVIPRGKTVIEYGAHRTIYNQGDPADAVFYVRRGKVKLAVTSRQGKEGIVAVIERRGEVIYYRVGKADFRK